MPPYRVAYLVSHPIQYQAPMLRRIAAEKDIALTVFFCSASSMRAYRDEGFSQTIQWDVPLTEGYDHRFLPALGDDRSPTPFRPFNWGLAQALREGGYDLLWTHGYTRLYNLVSMYFAHRRGIRVLNRDEAWERSSVRGPLKRAMRRAFFVGLRRICDGWLAIGTANRDYYLAQGMAPETVFFMPYTVDNDRFRMMAQQATAQRDSLRAELGIAPGSPVVLFASKFQQRKRTADLVEAFARIQADPACRMPVLVLVGDGEQRAALEALVASRGLEQVRFAGFRNQSEMPQFYDLCDVFVLPSSNEPWGLVVNEVMNAARAVIVSDEVGAGQDLVCNGENGFVFPVGDVAALAEALRRVLADEVLSRRMGERSLEIISHWSFEEDVQGLRQALDACLRKDIGV